MILTLLFASVVLILSSLVHTLSGPSLPLQVRCVSCASFDEQTTQILSSLCVSVFLFPLLFFLTPFSFSLGNLLGSSLSFLDARLVFLFLSAHGCEHRWAGIGSRERGSVLGLF